MKKSTIMISAIIILVIGFVVYASWPNDQKTALEPVEEEIVLETPVVDDKEENKVETKVENEVKATTPTVVPKVIEKNNVSFIDYKVPFTSQAPTGNWDDERQQDGCEEASDLMAVYWAQGKTLNSTIALEKILGASDYALKEHGEFRDISVDDTVQWIFKEYFKFNNVVAKKGVTINDIISELEKGNVVVIPANGQKLGNPYFSPPGPERHMLLIRGYDKAKKQFITNDPGTKRGQAYRYNENVLYNAILSYSTGSHEPVTTNSKDIIVVSK